MSESESELRAELANNDDELYGSVSVRVVGLTLLLVHGEREKPATSFPRRVLREIYSHFTEGFETHDLKTERTLLRELSFVDNSDCRRRP